MSSWMELWTVAMTTGLPVAERIFTHRTKSFQSRRSEPFFTTRPVGQGIGLGLSVCQRYARLNRAELSAESVAGAGAVFRLTLERCSS